MTRQSTLKKREFELKKIKYIYNVHVHVCLYISVSIFCDKKYSQSLLKMYVHVMVK